MIRTITLELDVPPGHEANVSDMAYAAIEMLNLETLRRNANLHAAAKAIHVAFPKDERPEAAQNAIDGFREAANQAELAKSIVTLALSEISFAMSEADRQWRVGQAAQPKEEAAP